MITNKTTDSTDSTKSLDSHDNLCFLNTINWDFIARWDAGKNYISQNKSPGDCPSPSLCEEASCPLSLCWSSTDCQFQVNDTYKDCDPQCLGGCSGPGPRACHSCHKLLTINGECVSECPPDMYVHMNRRCVTKDHCLSLIDHQNEHPKSSTFVVFNGTCIQNCPPGYDYTQDRKGCEKCEKGKCRKVCPGLSIDDVAAAQNLKGCTFINGSLEIAIKQGIHKSLAEELEDNLKSVEEIRGYLKIIRFPLVNLKFFRNLEIIHGDEPLLENSKYSLIVLDNQNLQDLWDSAENGTFKIINGRIYFHYNPKLCFYHIQKLINITGLKDISNFEVAQESNGDKFACNTTDVIVTFPKITSNSVLINILLPNNSTPRPILQRYILYYTEAEGKNVSVFEETDECGDDSWNVRDVLVESEQQVSTIQTFLKPFTHYAFYVKTYTVQSIGGQSPIYYIRTLPSLPSEVMLTFFYSNHSSTIVLQWMPPKHPNGIISHYLVTGFWLKDDRELVDRRDYCHHPMIEETVEVQPPDLLTNIHSETETCCPENQIVYNPRGVYDKICDNSEQQKIFFDDSYMDITLNCGRLLYNYISESSMSPEQNLNKDERVKLEINKPQLKTSSNYSENFIHGKYNSKTKNKSILKRHTQNNEDFRATVTKDTTIIVLKNLRHFAKYIFSIRACRKKYKNETDNFENRCGKSELAIARTLKDPDADNIDDAYVKYEVIEENDSDVLEIKWLEPQNPNGIILVFEVEHKRSDLENSKATIECLTHIDYIQNGKKFTLRGLPPGKYTFRLRAVSLAGPSSFTKKFEFEIKIILGRIYYRILLSLIAILAIASIGAGYYWYILFQRRKYSLDLDQLLASAITEQTTSPPYIEDSWEIDRENIQIVNEIGKGTFGKVYEGILFPVKLPCAIKTVSEANVAHSTAFINEITVMKRAAGVHHVIQLLGVVSRGNPPLLVMELMTLGDLKSYLRSNRELPPLNSRMLLIAAQIADAMFFMEVNKFVHRDLAARNCLVHKDLTVKVGDFGLTRDIYTTDYYRKGDKGLWPIRWMPPESMRDGIFTTQSDVWSYGVVLWEIATLAELPYGGLSNEEVLRQVVGGTTHLSSPVFCPEPLKTIMKMCWQNRPNHRPTFRQLVAYLEPYTDDVFKCVSYYNITLISSDNDSDTNLPYCQEQPQIRFLYG